MSCIGEHQRELVSGSYYLGGRGHEAAHRVATRNKIRTRNDVPVDNGSSRGPAVDVSRLLSANLRTLLVHNGEQFYCVIALLSLLMTGVCITYSMIYLFYIIFFTIKYLRGYLQKYVPRLKTYR